MLSRKDIKKIAKTRLTDARILLNNKRWDGAVYLCGYAIELGLKCKICEILNWQEYPETRSEFNDYRTFKTHNLDVLLHLSGIESHIKANYLSDWSIVAKWKPEARYEPVGKVRLSDAKEMLKATQKLLKAL
ncbi:hypothetical protein CEE34_02910 [Candidatus Aerophobetes bacterium Ae_b3a]|nr:MAG: hypothetical protein CEE34_02910 [Candidatus Aerophobetes bacterium Ae_b3a]